MRYLLTRADHLRVSMLIGSLCTLRQTSGEDERAPASFIMTLMNLHQPSLIPSNEGIKRPAYSGSSRRRKRRL